MISSFLLLLTLNTSCFFIFMGHPLAIGLILLVQTCLVALLTGSLGPTFWFSYILFLVFLGGILVLFIYITRLASNEIFTISYPMLSRSPVFIGVFILRVWATYLFNWVSPNSLNINSYTNLLDPSLITRFIIKLYTSLTSHLTMLLACYLFLTLIVVVNVTRLNQGPLRTHII